jgi:zinc transporter ZupT
MPDADERLSSVVPDYPICNALVAVGVFCVLSIEQIILIIHNSPPAISEKKHDCAFHSIVAHMDMECPHDSSSSPTYATDYTHHHNHGEECHEECPLGEAKVDHNHDHDHDHHSNIHQDHDHHKVTRAHSSSTHQDHDHGHGHNSSAVAPTTSVSPRRTVSHSSVTHDHDHAAMPLDDLLAANTFRELVSAYALEISTAIHSIIIGFDLGVLTSVRTASILCVVLAFHQFVEGLGLGSVIKSSQQQLGTWKILSFVLIFSSTVSVGVLLGLLIKPSHETPAQSAIVGSATAIAAGSLLYISLVEMTSEYFNLPELEKKGKVKLLMLFLYCFGVGLMAVIGVWA